MLYVCTISSTVSVLQAVFESIKFISFIVKSIVQLFNGSQIYSKVLKLRYRSIMHCDILLDY